MSSKLYYNLRRIGGRALLSERRAWGKRWQKGAGETKRLRKMQCK